ncbi:type II toxin-antitoxin system HicB family antitoxin [Undibacterium sp. SXout7W]|uniref:type II toxin-antitoxin system HicB family antitoxin n=1 Tax=Undibacterium sp. SXout7W TaxID=3413049 RepID=UPI003BF1E32C
MKYPAKFAEDTDGGYVVTFRDIPEAITQGETLEEASEMAAEVLLSAMDFYFEDSRPVTLPSAPLPGEYLIELPLSAAAKVLLLNEMLHQKVTPAELARRLDTSPQTVNRLVDLHHVTKIDAIQSAAKALGKTIEISFA